MREVKQLKYAIAGLGITSFIFALSALSSELWWTSDKGSHGIWTAKVAEKREALRIGEYRGYKGLEAVRGFQLTNTLILLAAGVFSFVKAVKGDNSRASGIGSAFATSFTFSGKHVFLFSFFLSSVFFLSSFLSSFLFVFLSDFVSFEIDFALVLSFALEVFEEVVFELEEFFDLYNTLFYEIPAEGSINSHTFLIERSFE